MFRMPEWTFFSFLRWMWNRKNEIPNVFLVFVLLAGAAHAQTVGTCLWSPESPASILTCSPAALLYLVWGSAVESGGGTGLNLGQFVTPRVAAISLDQTCWESFISGSRSTLPFQVPRSQAAVFATVRGMHDGTSLKVKVIKHARLVWILWGFFLWWREGWFCAEIIQKNSVSWNQVNGKRFSFFTKIKVKWKGGVGWWLIYLMNRLSHTENSFHYLMFTFSEPPKQVDSFTFPFHRMALGHSLHF